MLNVVFSIKYWNDFHNLLPAYKLIMSIEHVTHTVRVWGNGHQIGSTECDRPDEPVYPSRWDIYHYHHIIFECSPAHFSPSLFRFIFRLSPMGTGFALAEIWHRFDESAILSNWNVSKMHWRCHSKPLRFDHPPTVALIKRRPEHRSSIDHSPVHLSVQPSIHPSVSRTHE